MLTSEQKEYYDENGYFVAKNLLSNEEVEFLRDHYMEIRLKGPYEFDMVADTSTSNDPLLQYPRMAQMHRWDKTTLQFMLDTRLNARLTSLLGAEPLAVQSMIYFKPPGARGQALHQDNIYLRAQPGTCMAAWLALDDCDEENGCMQVVGGSHTWPLLCPTKADAKTSFTDVTTPLPDGVEPTPVVMQAGDVLFFNGTVVHGSFPNTSSTRFRRSLIAHYVEGHTNILTSFDQPVLRMDGTSFTMKEAEGGGECGKWIDIDGQPAIEMIGELAQAIGTPH